MIIQSCFLLVDKVIIIGEILKYVMFHSALYGSSEAGERKKDEGLATVRLM